MGISDVGDRALPLPDPPDTRYVPVDGAPWALSMGLHRLDLAAWLEVDGARAAELAEKDRLLRDERATVLVETEPARAACNELLELVIASLATSHPGLIDVEGTTVREHSRSVAIDTMAVHPLETAARLVQEDLCVMQRDDASWRLTAACVCFPSRWRLTEKVGTTLAEIHGPVPGYHATLERPSTTFFDRLAPSRPVWRLNWTILDSPSLHLPSPSARAGRPVDENDLGRALWFRVERQTLRRLERTDAIAFTIRTYVDRLDGLLARDATLASRLRDTLRTVDADVAAYKGWTTLLEPLDSWLAGRAAQR